MVVYKNQGYRKSIRYSYRQLSRLRSKKKSFKGNFEEYDYPALDRYFIDQLEYAMRRKWNNHFTRPYALKRDITEVLLEHIEDCIRSGRNVVCEVNNKSGLGKSLIAVWLWKIINDLFIKYLPQKIRETRYSIRNTRVRILTSLKSRNDNTTHKVNYTNHIIEKLLKKINLDKQFLKDLKKVRLKGEIDMTYSTDFSGSKNNFTKLLPGGCNLQDENNELSGSGSRTFAKAFKNIIKAFRVKQKNYILATPDFAYVPNLHFILTPLGFAKDKPMEQWQTRALVRYIDPEKKTLKALYLGYALLDIGSIVHLLDVYDVAKLEALEHLEDSGGIQSGSLTEDQKSRDKKKLFDYAKNKDYDGKSKKVLKNWLIFDLNMDTDVDYMNYLIDEVFNEFNKEKDETKKADQIKLQEHNRLKYKIDDQNVFDIPYEKILEDFDIENTNWRNVERDIEIFKLKKGGLTYQQIRDKLNIELSDPQFSAIKKKYDGYISDVRGEMYEIHKANKLRENPEYKDWEVIRNGAKGEPDVYAISSDKTILEVYSCKCFEISKNSLSIPMKKFSPEIDFALKNHNKYNKIFVFADIFDHLNKKPYQKQINYLKPEKSVIIHKEL